MQFWKHQGASINTQERRRSFGGCDYSLSCKQCNGLLRRAIYHATCVACPEKQKGRDEQIEQMRQRYPNHVDNGREARSLRLRQCKKNKNPTIERRHFIITNPSRVYQRDAKSLLITANSPLQGHNKVPSDNT